MIEKILIVDDSRVARRMLKHCIPRERGYEIHEAEDGREAVEKYQRVNPDLTFMDLTMPVMNGFEATEEIMEYDGGAMIVVTTADVQPRSIRRVLSLGAFDVIRKPPRPNSIQEAMAKVENKLQDALE